MSLWRQFRQLYPVAAPALLLVLLLDGFLMLALLMQGIGDLVGAEPSKEVTPEDVIGKRTWLYIIVAGVVVAGRLARTNPAREPYLTWLRMTPWTIRQPLPLGPFLPSWPDGVVLMVLTGLSLWAPLAHPAVVPLACVGTYFIYLTLQLLLAGRWRYVLVALAIGALAAVSANGWIMLACAVGGAVWVTGGMRALLEAFHCEPMYWSEDAKNRALIFQGEDAMPQLRIEASASPASWLLRSRDKIEPMIRGWVGLMVAVGTGGIAWQLTRWGMARQPSDDAAFPAFICVGAIAFFRWAVYEGYAPISLRGRLRTGRWIIPAYDRAVVVPLAILVLSLLVWRILERLAVAWPPAVAITVSIAMALALCVGPTRGVHRLTGAQNYITSRRVRIGVGARPTGQVGAKGA